MQQQSIENQDKANKIIKRFDSLKASRANWEGHWREINDYISPTPDTFSTTEFTKGEKRNQRMFDSTATLALNRFAAAMESMLTPRTQRWHTLKARDMELSENFEVKEWIDEVVDALFSARYNAKANFASQTYECYRSLGKYGTSALFIDEEVGVGLRYKAVHLSELFIAENHVGIVDTVYRRFAYTAYQAVTAFGEDNVPGCIKEAYKNSPDREFDFVHAVYPNEEYDKKKRGGKSMKYKSCYVSIDGKLIVRESGYRTFPYAVSRYMTNTNETYGRCPSMDCLQDIKSLNQYVKNTLRAAEYQINPPLLAQENGIIKGFDLRPGGINYGAINGNGQQVVQPMQMANNFQVAEYLINDKRQLINDTFLVTLFQILVENKTMTATEAMYRQQEKGALLAPTMGRQQGELLGPMIERELDILNQMGKLPKMPDVMLMKYEEDILSGKESNAISIDVDYVSPLTRAQRSEEGVAILNLLQVVNSVAQAQPDVLKTIDFNKVVDELSEIYGAPAEIRRSPEEVQAMKDAEANQQQLSSLLQAAPIMADTSKTLAETQNIATQGGPAMVR